MTTTYSIAHGALLPEEHPFTTLKMVFEPNIALAGLPGILLSELGEDKIAEIVAGTHGNFFFFIGNQSEAGGFGMRLTIPASEHSTKEPFNGLTLLSVVTLGMYNQEGIRRDLSMPINSFHLMAW